ncbi:transporter [Methylobacterium brachythecii]|uniref:Transporter n=2 Tax=Methylobacterium brachythecii TaxID=1176177 RepID=A0ABQ6D018_9HYPH|nr:transporter [Methylobacterium brachythecii]
MRRLDPGPGTDQKVAEYRKNGHVMKISARNVIKGKIVSVEKGATTAHVKIEVAPGQVITSSITNEAVDSLKLTVGSEAYAVVKSSDVMIAVD